MQKEKKGENKRGYGSGTGHKDRGNLLGSEKDEKRKGSWDRRDSDGSIVIWKKYDKEGVSRVNKTNLEGKDYTKEMERRNNESLNEEEAEDSCGKE